MKKRIWELDAVRGFCILCVIAVHFIFDIEYFGGKALELPAVFEFVKQNGGVLFILISGICVTLGSRSAKRGAVVLAAGLLISAVTFAMYKLGFADRSVLIYWGILHLLGFSMLVWPLYKKWPLWLTGAAACLMIISGYYLYHHDLVQTHLLFMFGLTWPGFAASDHFPILPFMGWFMLGTILGRTLYRDRKTLFPRADEGRPVIRFFGWCGRQSLWIYLIHQPVLYLLTMLISGGF